MSPTRSIFSSIVLYALVAVLAPVGSAQESDEDSLTAKQILDRMAETYAECKTYHDSGVVKTVFIRDDHRRTVEKPFTTAFVRPDRFRFEYKEKKRSEREYRDIVWRKGEEVRTWWDVKPGIKKPKSLNRALAAATGVSDGSAHTIPALLLPEEVSGRRLTGITEAKRVEGRKLGKVECFRIKGKYADDPMTLWIEKSTFLVWRIDSQDTFDDFRTEETTTYDPVINEDIPDKLLEFDPPKQESSKEPRPRSGE